LGRVECNDLKVLEHRYGEEFSDHYGISGTLSCLL
jgi:hypothetical protein